MWLDEDENKTLENLIDNTAKSDYTNRTLLEVVMKIYFVGGDKRQIAAMNCFAVDGAVVECYGFDVPEAVGFAGNIILNDKLGNSMKNSDVIVLPIPSFNADGGINMKLSRHSLSMKDFFNTISSGTMVVAAKVNTDFKISADKMEIKWVDLLDSENFSILNAVPTAEAVIKIAIERSGKTLQDSNVMVLGYGRVGKTCARLFKTLSKSVWVAARKQRDLGWIVQRGFEPIEFGDINKELGHMDIIINTVPAMVLYKNRLKLLNKDCVVIDVASFPGGVDFHAAEEMRIDTGLYLSLPGKYSPDTAGRIVYKVVKEYLV